MIGYATVGTNDLDRAAPFYDALAEILGSRRIHSFDRGIFYGETSFEFALVAPFDGKAAVSGNGSMVALEATSREAVDKVHTCALAMGGVDEGAPGIRGREESGFYGAYFRDLDGNKLCVFFQKKADLSSVSKDDDGAEAASAPVQLARPLPAIDDDNQAFWTGGERGELLIYRCADCRYYVHPPTSFCPQCESRAVGPEPVSGRGSIVSLTLNYKAWFPDMPVPYAVALVGLEEQPSVHLVTNIVDCDPEKLRIGDRVKVHFEQNEDLWVPLFAPEVEGA